MTHKQIVSKSTKLSQRLQHISGLTMGIALAIVAVIVITSSFVLSLNNVIGENQVKSKVLADNVSASLLFKDELTAREVLQSLRHSPEVHTAAIYSSDNGKIFADYMVDGHQEHPALKAPHEGISLSINHIELTQPVLHDDRLLGYFYLHIGLDSLYRQILWHILFIFLAISAALIINKLLIVRLSVSVLQPISHLIEIMDKVPEQADYDINAQSSDIIELDSLSRGFNNMLVEIKQRDAHLKKYSTSLEHMVAERTAKLGEQAHILGQIRDAVVSTDLNGIVTSWNKGAERLVGYTADEAMGQHISFIYPEEEHAMLSEILEPSKIKGKHETEVMMLRKTGENFHALLSQSLLHDVDGKVRGMISFSIDITERKRAEQALIVARDEAERANQAKSDFLSRMSHELRTPMNAILGFGQLMETDPTLPVALQECVKEILKAGNHLLELINEVLDLAKVESGNIEMSLEAVEVVPVIDECMTLIGTLAERQHIQLDHGNFNNVAVLADRTRFKQALLNLLSNAVKYNREGGSVKLTCKELDNNQVRIVVSDTGKGIPSGQINDLFKPFNRLDEENGEIEGTGIGLTLTLRIIELMGGKLGVNSEFGVGSTFWIDLPLENLDESIQDKIHWENVTSKTPEELYNSTVQHTMLYIEDNPANLKLVSRILDRRQHIHMLTAHTAQLGIEVAKVHRPELILLDINMPGMDGYEVLEYFKSDSALKEVPVVAITANAMPNDVERAKEAGFKDYLIKPLDVDKFNETIDQIFDSQST